MLKKATSVEVGVEVILFTELFCDGDTGEVLTPVTLDGKDVKQHGQRREQAQEHQQEDANLDPLSVHVQTSKTGKKLKNKQMFIFIFLY